MCQCSYLSADEENIGVSDVIVHTLRHQIVSHSPHPPISSIPPPVVVVSKIDPSPARQRS